MRTSTLSPLVAWMVVASAACVGCVDGQTPDCSDAAARCGPDYDAYPPDTADDSPPGDAPNEGAADTGAADMGASDTKAETAAETGADAGAG